MNPEQLNVLDFRPTSAAGNSGTIGVFVSSTFRDMRVERDVLVKETFPALRQLFDVRGLSVAEVDLRWGVSSEDVAEGQVLPVCFAEIERCSPFFIALLGERYGARCEIPPGMMARHLWLGDHLHASVTELEIQHGLLRRRDGIAGAACYFRSCNYLERLPAGAARRDYEAEDEASKHSLIALKAAIRASGCRVRRYSEPRDLAILVLEDLREAIDAVSPTRHFETLAARERAAHETHAAHLTRVFVPPSRALRRLDEHLSVEGPPLVVTGASGCGKSTLLANWLAARSRASNTKTTVARGRWWSLPRSPRALSVTMTWAHFVGATPDSRRWTDLVQRLLSVTRDISDVRPEEPDQLSALRTGVSRAVTSLVRRGRILIVLDGLDQLDPQDQAHELEWLPRDFPPDARVVLSVGPGKMFERLRERQWNQLSLPVLDEPAREALTMALLKQSGKRLDATLLRRIREDEQCASPRYLRTVIDELRVSAEFESLEHHVERYVSYQSYPELLSNVLNRLEQDFDSSAGRGPSSCPGLVRFALSAVCGARWGLADDELFAAASLDGRSITMADWAALRVALGDRMITRAGVTTVADSSLKQAIETRYLSDELDRRTTHERLAAVFWAAPRRRQVQELPWHLEAAGAWPALRSILTAPDFLEAAWQESASELARWWGAVVARAGGANLANEALSNVQPADRPAARIIGLLLRQIGRPAEALAVAERVIDSLTPGGEAGRLRGMWSDRAVMLIDLGRMDEAHSALSVLERLCRSSSDPDGESLRSCLSLQAVVARAQGDATTTSRILNELETLCRQAEDDAGIAAVLLSRGEILAEEDPGSAIEQLIASERLWRAIGDYRGVATALGHQAIVWRFRGDLTRAVELHQQEEGLSRAIGDRTRLEATLANQASIAMQQLDFDRAIKLLREAEGLCRESGHTAALVRCLIAQGGVFYNLGLDAQARLRLGEALAFAEGHGLAAQSVEARELLARLDRVGNRLP